MKKRLFYILSLTLLFLICTSGCESSNFVKPAASKTTVSFNSSLNTYKITAKLDTKNKCLSCTETVTYINKSNTDFDHLYFHIYPNAYEKRETAPVLFDQAKYIYPEGFKAGGLKIIDLTSDGAKLKYGVTGRDNTLLEISPLSILKSGEKIELNIKFDVMIPEARDRLGFYNDCFNLGNWYPIAAVFDEKGWNLAPYYSVGDPFYSDVSNYNVSISVPKSFDVAATGDLVNLSEIDSSKIYNFQETNVRDFAWITSNNFLMNQAVVDGTTIKCYTYKKNKNSASSALAYAKKAITSFNTVYGKYPYKNYSVVETGFASGMEYPELVYISDQYYTSDTKNSPLETVIAHETAHQWWYGVVGDDEVNEAWLDESFAAFSEGIYYEKQQNNNSYASRLINQYNSTAASDRSDGKILKPVSQFDWNDYGRLVYVKGAVMLDTLRYDVGDDKFFNIMRTYYSNYKFKNAKTQNFIDTVNKITGKNYDEFFNVWLLNK